MIRLSPFSRLGLTVATGFVLLGGSLAQITTAHSFDFSWGWDDPVIAIHGRQVTPQ